MQKETLLYEGKAKQIYSTADGNKIIVHYKDDATAGNGAKKQQFEHKGEINAAISTLIFEYLIAHGIPTHFIKQLNKLDVLCDAVTIFPLEVIIRNVATGSLTSRLGVKEGTKLVPAIPEICYKNDVFGDPLINDYHAIALGLATREELTEIYQLLQQINMLLQTLFDAINIVLVDFKLEFGKNAQGQIVLADEISPDTCRFWDKDTMEKLDKDRFRQDLGHMMDAYAEILSRLQAYLKGGNKA